MMNFFAIILLVSVAISNGEILKNSPGRAVFWSPAQSVGSKAAAEYQTQSIESSELNILFDEKAKKNEIVALFKSADGRPVLSHNCVKESIRDSSRPLVLPNIYQSETREPMLKHSETLKNVKRIDLNALLEILRDHESSAGARIGPMNNGQIDAYEIVLNGHETEHEHMKTITSLAKNSIFFAAIEEPMSQAVLPTSNGDYSRVLSSTASSSNLDGIYYKPEGAEYSIYYADTYLYLTPDIFTGLMTGIFVFFVLLTGYSCLGAIQGNSCYPTKMPVVGREA
jgi:hypothetical protein